MTDVTTSRVEPVSTPKKGKKQLARKALPEEKAVMLRFPTEYYLILEELSEAFHKTGAIEKPSVSHMIKWVTDRTVTEVLTKKRELLVKELKAEVDRKAQVEYENKLRSLGYLPTQLQQLKQPGQLDKRVIY